MPLSLLELFWPLYISDRYVFYIYINIRNPLETPEKIRLHQSIESNELPSLARSTLESIIIFQWKHEFAPFSYKIRLCSNILQNALRRQLLGEIPLKVLIEGIVILIRIPKQSACVISYRLRCIKLKTKMYYHSLSEQVRY